MTRPLADLIRPQSLEDVYGHAEITRPGGILDAILKMPSPPPLLLYGPPGCGKTTIATIIAKRYNARFVQLSGATTNLAQIRNVLRGAEGGGTLLFMDEIQRLNATQQQVLLPYLEKGGIYFIGASVQNPLFAIIPALNSRLTVIQLNPLDEDAMVKVLKRAIETGLRDKNKVITEDALKKIARFADGDARKAINLLELAENLDEDIETLFKKNILMKQIKYDASGDFHYDYASAFIKSMRASDVEKTLYWLSKMLYAGEDPRFIIRRMMIFASEDIGPANHNALLLVNAALNALNLVGLPEAEYNIYHAAFYLAQSPKSRKIADLRTEYTERLKKESTTLPPKFMPPKTVN